MAYTPEPWQRILFKQIYHRCWDPRLTTHAWFEPTDLLLEPSDHPPDLLEHPSVSAWALDPALKWLWD